VLGRRGEVAHRGVLRALLGDGGRLPEGEPPGVARPLQAQLVRVVGGAAAVDADEACARVVVSSGNIYLIALHFTTV
jgi:hypothetical protein